MAAGPTATRTPSRAYYIVTKLLYSSPGPVRVGGPYSSPQSHPAHSWEVLGGLRPLGRPYCAIIGCREPRFRAGHAPHRPRPDPRPPAPPQDKITCGAKIYPPMLRMPTASGPTPKASGSPLPKLLFGDTSSERVRSRIPDVQALGSPESNLLG